MYTRKAVVKINISPSTVFPRIVSAETIHFWKWKMWKFSYIDWSDSKLTDKWLLYDHFWPFFSFLTTGKFWCIHQFWTFCWHFEIWAFFDLVNWNFVKAKTVVLSDWPSDLYSKFHLDPPILNFLLTFWDSFTSWTGLKLMSKKILLLKLMVDLNCNAS